MIFLNILKIIGIVLVVILCVLLALILLVLFCPVKYRVLGTEVYDKENKSDIHIRLSWLFHLIGVNVDIDPELTAGLRILFVKKNLMKGSDTNIVKTDIEDTDNDITVKEEINDDIAQKEKPILKDEDVNTAENDSSDNKNIFDNTISDNDDSFDSDDTSEEESDAEREIKKEKIKRLTAKIKKILKDDSCKEALDKIKTELINLLKAIMPCKLYLKAEFSAGSPDKTGMALGVLAMFPIGYKNKWKIRPDFEREEFYIDSEFDIKGRIFLYKILVIAIRLLVDKNCRKLYNEIRK